MNCDWRTLIDRDKPQPPEHAAWLDQRVLEMSAKEWRVFRAAATMNKPNDLAELVSLTFSLHEFDYYYPAGDNADAGRLLAKHNYGAREDVLPHLDYAQIGAQYTREHGGMLVDGAYITQCSPGDLGRIAARADNIRESGVIPDDDAWTGKLHLRGPDGNELWLRLPDYGEFVGAQPDEVATIKGDLQVESLDECELVEAKCILSGINLAAQYDSIEKMAFEVSNLGYGLDEQNQGEPHFDEKLKAALAFENCDDVNFAIDIMRNLHCYDYVPDADLIATAENILPEKHNKQPIILDALDHEAYAAEHYLFRGMQKVDGGFFMRNDKEFCFEYSRPPEQRAADAHRRSLMQRLDSELEHCWNEFKTDMYRQDPEWLVHRADHIAATEAAYERFHGNERLGTDTMEKLLQFTEPLDILSDTMAKCMKPENNYSVDQVLSGKLNDPEIGYSYDQHPEFSGRPVEPEQNHQIGGYDGQA